MAAVLDLWLCVGVIPKNNKSSCPQGLFSQSHNFIAGYQQKSNETI